MTYQRPQRTPAEQAELDRADRRQFWIIAVIFTVAMVALTGLYVAVSSVFDPPSPSVGAAEQVDNPALDVPDGGAEPTSAGDRGGSEQLALLGGLVVAIGAGTAWVIHSSRKARRQLAAQRGGTPTDGDPAGGGMPSTDDDPAPTLSG